MGPVSEYRTEKCWPGSMALSRGTPVMLKPYYVLGQVSWLLPLRWPGSNTCTTVEIDFFMHFGRDQPYLRQDQPRCFPHRGWRLFEIHVLAGIVS